MCAEVIPRWYHLTPFTPLRSTPSFLSLTHSHSNTNMRETNSSAAIVKNCCSHHNKHSLHSCVRVLLNTALALLIDSTESASTTTQSSSAIYRFRLGTHLAASLDLLAFAVSIISIISISTLLPRGVFASRINHLMMATLRTRSEP